VADGDTFKMETESRRIAVFDLTAMTTRSRTIRKTSAARRNSHWAEDGIGTGQADGAVDPPRPRTGTLDILWGDWRSRARFCKLELPMAQFESHRNQFSGPQQGLKEAKSSSLPNVAKRVDGAAPSGNCANHKAPPKRQPGTYAKSRSIICELSRTS
jgi:hypothetical protein